MGLSLYFWNILNFFTVFRTHRLLEHAPFGTRKENPNSSQKSCACVMQRFLNTSSNLNLSKNVAN